MPNSAGKQLYQLVPVFEVQGVGGEAPLIRYSEYLNKARELATIADGDHHMAIGRCLGMTL